MQFAKTQSLKILLIFQTKIFHFRNKAYETKFHKTLVNSFMKFFFRNSFFLINLEGKFYFL